VAIIDQDFTVYRGSAPPLNFTMTPVADITGWAIRFTAARALGSSSKAIISQAASVTSGPGGTFTVPLTAALTDIRPADYFYDVWRVDPGSEELLATGTMTLADVVRLPT
jgi:hypothetical protein